MSLLLLIAIFLLIAAIAQTSNQPAYPRLPTPRRRVWRGRRRRR